MPSSIPQIIGMSTRDGSDPRSTYFWRALERRGALVDLLAVTHTQLSDLYYKCLGFDPNRERWRFKFSTNEAYLKATTRIALKQLQSVDADGFDTILQTGALFNVTQHPNKRIVSYHDGNLFTTVKSGRANTRVSAAHLRAALAFESEVYRGSQCIFTMSRWAADAFVRDAGVPANKVEPVGAGANFEEFPEPFDNRYDSGNILFVGYDFERKGGLVLLEAFNKVRYAIPRATLTIIGPSEIGKVGPGILVLGPVSKSTPDGFRVWQDAYRNATVFAMPSLWENFGLAFVEAMAYQLPCVGANVCAMPEIIADGECGYVVPPNDADALAARLIELLSDPLACKQMGRNAYVRARKNYTWDAVADKILQRICRL